MRIHCKSFVFLATYVKQWTHLSSNAYIYFLSPSEVMLHVYVQDVFSCSNCEFFARFFNLLFMYVCPSFPSFRIYLLFFSSYLYGLLKTCFLYMWSLLSATWSRTQVLYSLSLWRLERLLCREQTRFAAASEKLTWMMSQVVLCASGELFSQGCTRLVPNVSFPRLATSKLSKRTITADALPCIGYTEPCRQRNVERASCVSAKAGTNRVQKKSMLFPNYRRSCSSAGMKEGN